jgi:rubrerythrin
VSSDNKHSVKSKAHAAAKPAASEAGRKERLGKKWVCFSCGARFYDLNKPTPLCPRCNADQRQSPAAKAPATTSRARKKVAAAPPPPPPPPVKEAKKPRFADNEEEIGVAVDDDAEDIAADLEEELAEDLEGEGFEVSEGEGDAEEEADED